MAFFQILWIRRSNIQSLIVYYCVLFIINYSLINIKLMLHTIGFVYIIYNIDNKIVIHVSVRSKLLITFTQPQRLLSHHVAHPHCFISIRNGGAGSCYVRIGSSTHLLASIRTSAGLSAGQACPVLWGMLFRCGDPKHLAWG